MAKNRTAGLRGGLRLKLLLLMLILLLIGASSSAADPFFPEEEVSFEVVDLPPEAQSLPAEFTANLRVSDNPKLDSAMASLADAAKVSVEKALNLANSLSLRLSGNRVHVQIVAHARSLKNVMDAVTKVGGEVTGIGHNNTLIQGWLPVDTLETFAARDDISLIRRPAYAYLLENLRAGNSTSEGLHVINAPAWHAAGYTGAGVKIGIIDGGFDGYTSLLGTDLPASVTVRNFVDGQNDAQVDGTSEHGTACAEIIHDMVPDAELYLAKIETNIDLAEAVHWLAAQQVDIISTSLGWYNLTPGDGTGELANLVSQARSNGILWITAAGNDRERHWGGLYSDPDADGLHNFNGDQEVNYFGPGDGKVYLIPGGYRIVVFLRWNDWADINQNYNLHLVRWNQEEESWELLRDGSSTDPQNGEAGQTPTEVAVAETTGSRTAYGFIIRRVNSNRAVNFEVFARGVPHLGEVLHARSLANLADAPDAMTVAALDVNTPFPQEPYSSEGPTNGPGGAAMGGFIKPDVSGFTNVSTESYGPGEFAGTSAATPHVAGAAALVLSAYPGHTPDQLQSFLERRATDMGSPEIDTQFGHGRLDLGAPPSIIQTPTPTPTGTGTIAATHTPTPTPNQTATPPPSDAENVELVGQLGGSAEAVAVAEDYAYVAADDSGLRIIDISNPAAPSEVGFYDTPGSAQDVAVAGGYAYVAAGYAGLRIIDVSNPAAPAEVGSYDGGQTLAAEGVAVAGHYVYYVDSEFYSDRFFPYSDGLHIFDVSNRAAPTEVGFYDTARAVDVAVVGDYAYVAAHIASDDSLHIIDVSSPAAPSGIGFYAMPGAARGVAVAGGYAYVADGEAGLRLIDVSDPANPHEAGFYDTSRHARGVALAGGYAYIADGYGGLRVIDVSNPTAPSEVGFYDTSGEAQGVALAGGYAYLAGSDGLLILRFTGAEGPSRTATPTPTATSTSMLTPAATPTPTRMAPLTPTPTSTLPSTEGPALSIPRNIPARAGGVVGVAVNFTSNGNEIASTVFSVDFDQTCLAFDPTDGDANDIPDAITFSVPAAFNASVTFDASDPDGELDFFVSDVFPPLAALPDGTMATITFTATCQPDPGSIIAPVGFSTAPPPSWGNTSGQSVSGTASDGSVEILSGSPADANGDGQVDAGDISALVLEIFDGDGNDPADTPGSTFPGDPVGCDANQDGIVDAGDIACTGLIIFNGPGACGGDGGLTTRARRPRQRGVVTTSKPSALVIPDHIPAPPGGRVSVPVNFTSNGDSISSLVFSVDFDEAWLNFDPTDSNGDGIPDAVTFNVPAAFSASVTFDNGDTDGELDFFIADLSPPLTALSGGPIVFVRLGAGGPSAPTQAAVNFSQDPPASFGNTSGESVSGITDSGSVLIATPTAGPLPTSTVYLPLILRGPASPEDMSSP